MTNIAKWEKIGQPINSNNIQDALIECNANYTVASKNIYTKGLADVDGIPVIGQQVPMKAITRTDTNDVLGVVGNNYQPIQNMESFDFFDELVQSKQAKYTYGGTLPNGPYADGAKVFIVAELNDKMIIGPDECKQTIILQSSHDGSSAVHVQFLVYRLVCSNGLIAVDKERSNSISIRHTKNYNQRIMTARNVLGTAERYFQKMQEVYNMFYESPFSYSDMKNLSLEIFPDDVEGKAKTQRENKRNELMHLFENGAGHNAIRNTKWAAYNAIAEFTDHKTGKTTKNKSAGVNEFNSVINGNGAKTKNKAFQLLVA